MTAGEDLVGEGGADAAEGGEVRHAVQDGGLVQPERAARDDDVAPDAHREGWAELRVVRNRRLPQQERVPRTVHDHPLLPDDSVHAGQHDGLLGRRQRAAEREDQWRCEAGVRRSHHVPEHEHADEHQAALHLRGADGQLLPAVRGGAGDGVVVALEPGVDRHRQHRHVGEGEACEA